MFRTLALISSVALLASCKPSVKTVAVAPPKSVLPTKGATVALSATVLDTAGKPVPGATVTWASADPKVAIVEGGKVTALGSGLAHITATAGNVVGSAEVRVTIPAKLEVQPRQLELFGVGARAPVKAQVLDDSGAVLADEPVSFASSDEKVIRVEGNELVTAGLGTAKVTASAAGLGAELQVTVKQPEFAKVELQQTEVKLSAAGETTSLGVRLVDASGQIVSGVPVEWSSSDEKVVTVAPSGMVTAMKKGHAVVTAKAGDKKAEAKVTVAK
jgi:uncharacterized protein YjdB